MIETRRHPIDRTSPEAAGWLVSCLLHGGVAIGAVFFLQSLHLAQEAKPFSWNVAMIAPSPIAASLSPGTATVRPPAPPTPVPARSMTEPTPAQPAQSKPEPVEAAVASSLQPDPTAAASTALSSQATPAPEHVQAANPEPVPPVQDDSETTTTKWQAHQQMASVPTSQVDTYAAPSQSNPAKIDYGWLADLMARWIEDLDKRYPAMLRTEGIQGKVTLTALLHENGTLTDVRVAKSSGNTMLDQVAVEDVRKGPPITLSRPLERPHMPVKFSIIYDLKATR